MTRQGTLGQATVVVAGCALLAIHAWIFLHAFRYNAVDDAYISLRFAENLAAGHGPVFNVGERVEGYSNFLWVVLLSGFSAAGIDDLTWPATMTGLAFSMATLVLCAIALERVFKQHSTTATLWLVLLLAGSGYYGSWSVGGLETGLHAFLLTAAWLRYAIERDQARGSIAPTHWGSALLFAALALTRPDGALIALVAALFHLTVSLRDGRPLLSRTTWLFPSIILVTVGAYTAWRFAYFGVHLYPNSVRAKIGGGSDQLMRGLSYLWRRFALPYLPIALGACTLLYKPRTSPLMGLTLWLAWLALFAVAGGDWSHGRFFAPLLPLGCVLCVGALWPHVQRVGRSPIGAALLVLIAMHTYVSFHFTTLRRELPHRRIYGAGDAERVEIGRWLAETMPPDTKLAAFAIGQLAYYSKLYMHDMLGITDSHVAQASIPTMGQGTPGHEKSDVRHTLEVVSPEIIFDGRLVPMLERHPVFRRGYQRIDSFWKITEVAVRRDFLARVRPSLEDPPEDQGP